MARTVRTVWVTVYSALIIMILKSFLTDQNVNHVEINYMLRTPGILRKINREMLKNMGNITHFTVDKRPERLPSDLKYVLQWTEAYSHYNSFFKYGQQSFLENNCTYYNCFITIDRTLLSNPEYFDAILFDVENNWDRYPPWRVPYQRYIFVASESASHYPICQSNADNYYNWTWTYKLDSDIRWSYVTVLDKSGRFVGPKMNMSWIYPMESTPESVTDILKTKKKAVAWFVSSCSSKNGREKVAKAISKSLEKYSLKIDVYGWCGSLTCPKDRIGECLELLRTDYHFYLAFENSNSEDYVTEKILYPLQHYTVPIVFGGADYSRFLPPDSYINAGILKPDEVASLIHKAMNNREEYTNYFRWHNYYTYTKAPPEADICVLCRMLNDQTKNASVVKNFRRWWNSKYEETCKTQSKKKVVEII